MMDGPESFTEIVLSWSLEDIYNEGLYKHQSVQKDGACSYPLLDETRAQLQSGMESMHRAPFCQVNAIQKSKSYEGETKLYHIEIDGWRNSDCGMELYKSIQGDVLILADAKLNSVSDLRKLERCWSLLVVTEVSINQKEDGRTSVSLQVRALRELEVNIGNGTSLFLVFLANITPNLKIWNAIHMCISSRWKVLFSDNFMKSFQNLKSFQKKMSVLNLLLKLSSGWRPKQRNVDTICKSSLMTLKHFKVDDLYIVLTTDIEKDLTYIQVLRMWDLLPGLLDIQKLADRLDCIFKTYTDLFLNLCREKRLEGHLEVPASWPLSLDVIRNKDLSSIMTNSVGDSFENGSYVENSKVNESLLLMKFYSLSSGVVKFLLSDREGSEVNLPFEVTDQEREAVLYDRSTFILGRSGTGKTTVLTTKLYQKEEQHRMADEGFYDFESKTVLHNEAGQSSSSALSKGTVLRQLFVTVSPKLCFAVKQHFLHLQSFASGRSSLVDMDDFDDEEAQFRSIPDSFCDIPPQCYPLFITFKKFLMMLDGSVGNSYFERFSDITKLPRSPQQKSSSVVLQTFLTTKEVTYARFSSSYWPHFDVQLAKKLDASRVFTEIISHIKGGLGALEAGDGKISRSDYVQMSECRASSLCQKEREKIYDIYLAYEKMKARNGEFDIADFVNDIHHRLKREKYKGDEINFVYIDEVQDLAMSQIALFKHICSNVEEGFVFSGDTAQTIARGIDFRFQDIRHLFYKKFVLESRREKDDMYKVKGKISEIFHLTQNFRSHDGVLKLLQSIVEVIYRFFPFYIDVLKPERSMIYGEAPILLYSGEDEKLFEKIVGSSGIIAGNMGGFGADQVILVRDDCSREEIFNSIGKQALVLTIMECKGLEFEDVLLYKFFGSSPLKNEWRVLYEFMQEQNLLDSTLPKCFPSFDHARHSLLCSELKHLYVAVSRTRQRLWIYENVEELSNPIFDYWRKQRLAQLRELNDSFAHFMQVPSTSGDWKSRGIKLYHESNYKMARMCFHKAGDTYWERRSEAAELKVKADHIRTSSPGEANAFLREAALIFESIGQFVSAARCFYDLGEYEQAGNIYMYKCGELELKKAGECFYLARNYERAAHVYGRGKYFFQCLFSCLQGNIFHKGLEYVIYWKQQAKEEYDLARQGDKTHEVELEILEHCAFHYYEGKDDRSRMKGMRDEMCTTLKALNARISSSSSKYFWEEKLLADLKRPSNKKYEKQISVNSLVYFWNSWKDTVVYLIEYLGSVDVNDHRSHGDFFLNYLGVWRHFHDVLNPLYLSLVLDIDWLRSIDKRSFKRNGESVSIDVNQLVLDAQSYWISDMLSVGIKVLDKLEVLYNFAVHNSDSVFCQCQSLMHIYEVAVYLQESKYLKLTHYNAETFYRFVKLSTDKFFPYVFPFDWRRSSREDMISLRQTDTCKCLLNQVIVQYINSTNRLSSGQMECIAMIILGSGNLSNELHEKLVKNIDCNSPWKKFLEDLSDNIQSELPEGYNREQPQNATVLEYSVAPDNVEEQTESEFSEGYLLGNISQEPREVSLLWRFHDALVVTYRDNWSSRWYNIPPDCFLYLVDRLLIGICCTQGYAITTRSCFIERLIYKEEHNQVIVDDVRISFECILQFLTDVVQELLFDKMAMTKWIKMYTKSWKMYYKLLMQRLVFVLCLLYLNFGMGFDVLLDLLRRKYVTDQLPEEFCYALRGITSLRDSLSRHVDVLARAFKKSGNPLVVASFGIDCSRFVCSDVIFINMKVNLCMAEIVRSLFPKHLPSMARSLQEHTHTIENLRHWNRSNSPLSFDPLWELLKGFKPAKERDHCNIFSDASAIKLEVKKIIRLLAAAWTGIDKEERMLSTEVLSMLDILVQLYTVIDGSEQELGNNMATVADLSRKLQWRCKRFCWPEKIPPGFTKLYLECNSK